MILVYGKQYLTIPRGDEINGIEVNGGKPLQPCWTLWFVHGSLMDKYYSSSTSGLQSTFPGLCGPRGGEALAPQSTSGVSSDCASPLCSGEVGNTAVISPCLALYVTQKRPWPERKGGQDRWRVKTSFRGNQLLRSMLFCKISSFHYFRVLAAGRSWDLSCASCGGLGKDFAGAHL